MLITKRRVEIDEAGVVMGRLLVSHSAFTVRLIELRGGVLEDEIFPADLRATRTGWPVLSVPLDGRGMVRGPDQGRGLDAGVRELVWAPAEITYSGRTSGIRVLVVQWDPSVFGGPSASFTAAPLSAVDFARWRDAADSLDAAGYAVEAASVAVASVFESLRALGFIDRAPTARELAATAPPEAVRRAGAAIDRALSSLDAGPAFSDVERELGCSPAHARRLVRSFGERAPLARATTWRDQKILWRLSVGATLMTSRRVTTERAARLLGFASPTVFCRACANAGLPSPGALPDFIARCA